MVGDRIGSILGVGDRSCSVPELGDPGNGEVGDGWEASGRTSLRSTGQTSSRGNGIVWVTSDSCVAERSSAGISGWIASI